MLHKKPVIAVDAGGIRDVFTVEREDKDYYFCKEGIVVKQKDARSFAMAMQYLLQNPELCKKMGMSGNRKVLDNFDENRMVEMSNSLFRNLIE